ncbi:hypothetical protein EHP00_2112 [Ecytonucleospora hepatopenaei]|uniref:Uncharacterized protein n=1 Tax=Ecytonucleospora hepatopenaei TaxID=646526 RepID=A0A1W0E426_9MICR|nr:hypothetical protein EHP00_2112 [Ecytonucleospora hepatopenaei]
MEIFTIILRVFLCLFKFLHFKNKRGPIKIHYADILYVDKYIKNILYTNNITIYYLLS